jgi:hypothetical protein
MKIAVLISGEYRTFGHCIRTMDFLYDPRVDIYVSTWDSSSYVSPKINLDHTELVNYDRVVNDLHKDATILIEPQSLIKEVKYSTKMMHRWISGFNLIKESNNHYDYVIVMRPDLFFNYSCPIDLNSIEQYENSLGVAWATDEYITNRKLQDVLFLSTYSNMNKLFSTLDINKWIIGDEGDWHTWWFNHCNNTLPIAYAKNFSNCTFYRYLTDNNNPTFDDVMNAQHNWRDLQLLNQIDIMGRDALKTAWPENVIQNAEDKWNNGYFNKFIK